MHSIRGSLEPTPYRRHRRRAVAVVAMAAAAALGLSGCTAGTTASSSAPTGKAVVADQITVGEQNAPPNLNPGTIDYSFTDFTMVAYDPLFLLTTKGTISPRLATGYKYLGTGNTVLDISLRHGVKFSDGEAFNAAAVAGSLSYTRDSKGSQSVLLAGMTFSAKDEYTVEVKMSDPNPDLVRNFTQITPVGQIIAPKAVKDPSLLSGNNTSYGAGPYIYQPSQSVPGDHYTYTANPTYYDKANQHFKTFTYKVISNQQAALNAAKTGQLDVSKGDVTEATTATNAGLQVFGSPGIFTGLFLVDRSGAASKPLGDVRVRQAINYALDRSAITKALAGKYGTPTFQTALEGEDGYSSQDSSLYDYNPTKAKQLLAAAGYKNGVTITIMAASFAGFDSLGEAIKGQLAKVGITVNLDVKSSVPAYVSGINSKQYGAFVGGYTTQPMHQQGIDFWRAGSQSWNPFHTTSSELDTLWTQAASAAPAQRATLDAQIEHYLLENAWFAPVFWAPVMYFAGSHIGGVATSASLPFADPLEYYSTQS